MRGRAGRDGRRRNSRAAFLHTALNAQKEVIPLNETEIQLARPAEGQVSPGGRLSGRAD